MEVRIYGSILYLVRSSLPKSWCPLYNILKYQSNKIIIAHKLGYDSPICLIGGLVVY